MTACADVYCKAKNVPVVKSGAKLFAGVGIARDAAKIKNYINML
jgi:hypothetical protein